MSGARRVRWFVAWTPVAVVAPLIAFATPSGTFAQTPSARPEASAGPSSDAAPKASDAALPTACAPDMAPLSGGALPSRPVEGETVRGKVAVKPFCMDRTEVTVDAYTACVTTGACTADHPGQWAWHGTFFADPKCNYGASERGNHPMNCVDFAQAQKYCAAQAKRLPTEDEWEWAARGGTKGLKYPWGSAPPKAQLCWSGVEKQDGTCAVGTHPSGDAPGEIHDLAGNVLEWTASSSGDPIVRGGSWTLDVASRFASSFRDAHDPGARLDDLGFRCVRDL